MEKLRSKVADKLINSAASSSGDLQREANKNSSGDERSMPLLSSAVKNLLRTCANCALPLLHMYCLKRSISRGRAPIDFSSSYWPTFCRLLMYLPKIACHSFHCFLHYE